MSEVKFSQRADVLNHLCVFGSITSWEAIKEYGATRLSSIIYELRKAGWNIGGQMVEGVNRYGNPVRYKRYELDKTQMKVEHVSISEKPVQEREKRLSNYIKQLLKRGK